MIPRRLYPDAVNFPSVPPDDEPPPPEEPVERLFSRMRQLGNRLGPVLYQLPPSLRELPPGLGGMDQLPPGLHAQWARALVQVRVARLLAYRTVRAQEAGEPVDETLTKAEASKRIDELQERTGRGRDH
mgnify:CR=1 FL=1